MKNSEDIFDLDEERRCAVVRFRELHPGGDRHVMVWTVPADLAGDVCLECSCGATLHLGEDIYVKVGPARLDRDERALRNMMVGELLRAIRPPRLSLFDPTPLGFFTYASGFARASGLANRDAFSGGIMCSLVTSFMRQVLGDFMPGTVPLGMALRACESDVDAFTKIEQALMDLLPEHAMGAECPDATGRPGCPERLLCGCGSDAAVESLVQSALVTLPDETLGKIRATSSRGDMHFGLGLYLRNRFIHNGPLRGPRNPDDLSGDALDGLIRHCLPEFREHDLVYERIGQGILWEAYRYCMGVRKELPYAELVRHYDMLLEAEAMHEASLRVPFGCGHRDEQFELAKAKWKEYDMATLREIWDFEGLRADVGDAIAHECEQLCFAAAMENRPHFIPAELGYVMAGRTDEVALGVFDWMVENRALTGYIPDSLFDERGLVLRAVTARGGLLERATRFQDDDEVVLAAISSDPDAVRFASSRLQRMSCEVTKRCLTREELERLFGDLR